VRSGCRQCHCQTFRSGRSLAKKRFYVSQSIWASFDLGVLWHPMFLPLCEAPRTRYLTIPWIPRNQLRRRYERCSSKQQNSNVSPGSQVPHKAFFSPNQPSKVSCLFLGSWAGPAAREAKPLTNKIKYHQMHNSRQTQVETSRKHFSLFSTFVWVGGQSPFWAVRSTDTDIWKFTSDNWSSKRPRIGKWSLDPPMGLPAQSMEYVELYLNTHTPSHRCKNKRPSGPKYHREIWNMHWIQEKHLKHICTEVCNLQDGPTKIWHLRNEEPATAGRFSNLSSRRLQLKSV